MKYNFKFNYKFNYKKYVLCLILLLLLLLSCLFSNSVFAFAENSNNSEEIKIELSQVVNDILEGVDLEELESVFVELDDLNLIQTNLKEKIKDILSGEYFVNYSSLFKGIISIFLVDVKELVPLLFTILAIGILASLLKDFSNNSSSTNDIVHFVCFTVLIIVVLFVYKDILASTSETISLIVKQIQIVFPILIVLLSSIGSFSTISIYNPLVSILTTIVSLIFDKFLYPLFIILFVLSIIGNLTNTVKVEKLQGFLSSCFKWIVGIVFTLFAGFLSIQGISAGRFDSVSIKATKFAVKSYIPIIGSYISEGMDLIVLGSVLVKNTIGLIGILVVFVTIASPIINMLVIKLGLQLTSALLDLNGSNKMSSFINNCSKILIYPIIIILGIAFMYTITIALIMCTANIF